MHVEVKNKDGAGIWGIKTDHIPRIGERLHIWIDVWQKYRHLTVTNVRWIWDTAPKVILDTIENDSY